jgi:hypothetical protein
MKLLSKNIFQDNYYTRREWVIRIAFCYNNNNEFYKFSRELYNLIKLKNELKKYILLKTLKYHGLAEKIIETEFDYCILSLNNIITNENVVNLRILQQQKEKEIVKHKIQILKQKENNHGLV